MKPELGMVLLAVSLLISTVKARSTKNLDLRQLISEVDGILRESRSVAPTQNPLVESGVQQPSVRVGAFNIQVFGDTKYGKTFVKEYLQKIIPRYDVLLVQEIRDADGDTILELLEDLNNLGEKSYELVISKRLGRSSSKEQYAYLYDPEIFQVETTYSYQDIQDYFERPPFGVILKSARTALGRFGLLGVHTKPTDAPAEISRLVNVYEDFQRKHSIEDVVLMGDFNAGCSYVTSSEWEAVSLRHDARFTWWIGDDVDTTVASSNCPYDRVVSAGDRMRRAIIPASVAPYFFDEEFGLSTSKADDISDHYPVEFLLYGKLSKSANSLVVKELFSVSGRITIESSKDIASVLTGDLGFDVTIYEISGIPSLVELRKTAVPCATVVDTLTDFITEAPGLMTRSVVAAAEAYMNARVLDQLIQFPGYLDEPEDTCNINLDYRHSQVTVSVSRAVVP